MKKYRPPLELLIASTLLTLATLGVHPVQAANKACSFPMKSKSMTCIVSVSNGKLSMDRRTLRSVRFEKNGLAGGTVVTEGCFWLNKKGTIRKTHCFDNGPDYFVEGLARYIGADGKFGFMNEGLEIQIPAQFTFAFPFEEGKSRVCNGCTLKTEGEHSSYAGGDWFTIDKQGRKVVEP